MNHAGCRALLGGRGPTGRSTSGLPRALSAPPHGIYQTLFENPGHGNRFLYVQLAGTASNRSAVGARIKVVVETPSGPRAIYRAAGSVSSFGSTPRRQEIGLGDATAVKSLEVWWPKSGTRQVFEEVPLDALVRVTEGSPRLERLELRMLIAK